MAAMSPPPIPQRIPPLTWRQPSVLWTPAALAVAIGWPAALFYNDLSLQQLAVILGAAVFALALTTLGASWALRRPPKTRRTAVMHVILAGAIACLAAPFALTNLLSAASNPAGAHFTSAMALAMLPLTIVLGLPMTLISAVMFCWIALKRPPPPEPEDVIGYHGDMQPFR